MGRWLARRLAQGLVTVGIVVVLVFFLVRLAPGDPLTRAVGDRAVSAEELARLRAIYRTDQPVWTQFRHFTSGVLRGDFGQSIEYGQPVTELIASRLPATALLGGVALLLNFSVGVWLGVAQAVRRGRPFDRLAGAASLAAWATPSFWLGLLLASFVGVRWRLLPAAGMTDPLLPLDASSLTRALDVASHLILPATTLTLASIAATIRHQRSAMIEALAAPFVQTARAKGLDEHRVTWHHAWRNALFPVVTLFGLWLPLLVTGAVFVEGVFAWPGIGSLAANAVSARDYPLLVGTVAVVSLAVVAGGILADLLYAALDPRVRLG